MSILQYKSTQVIFKGLSDIKSKIKGNWNLKKLLIHYELWLKQIYSHIWRIKVNARENVSESHHLEPSSY